MQGARRTDLNLARVHMHRYRDLRCPRKVRFQSGWSSHRPRDVAHENSSGWFRFGFLSCFRRHPYWSKPCGGCGSTFAVPFHRCGSDDNRQHNQVGMLTPPHLCCWWEDGSVLDLGWVMSQSERSSKSCIRDAAGESSGRQSRHLPGRLIISDATLHQPATARAAHSTSTCRLCWL